MSGHLGRAVSGLALLTLVALVGACAPSPQAQSQPTQQVQGVQQPGAGQQPAASGQQPAAAQPRQLIIATPATPVSADPEYSASLESWELPVFVYEYLVSYKFQRGAEGVGLPQFDGELEPRLAEKWTISPDGKKITFQLRKGVKSEFGNEFTAEDVRWSWARAFGLNTSGTWMMKSSSVANAEAITVVDPYTLEVNLTGPNTLLLATQATPLNSPVIYDSTEAKKHVTSGDPWAKEWLGTRSASFGPYKISKFTPGQEVVFDVNPNYYREKPRIQQVVYKEVPSSATRLQLLLSGSVHIARELDSRERQQLEGKNGVKLASIKGNNQVIFALNNQSAPFNNQKVRQAIALAAPVDDIIKTVYLSNPNVRYLGSYQPETYPAYLDYRPYYPTSIEKAQQLLNEAGQGPFAFTLSLNASRPEQEQIAVLIQTQLKKIGVDAQIDKLAPAKYQEQYFSRKAQSVLVEDAAWVADPSYSLGLWFGTGAQSVANWINYANPQADRLINEARDTADPEQRKAKAQQALKIIVDDAPWAFAIGTGFYVGMRDNVEGLNWRPSNLINYGELYFR